MKKYKISTPIMSSKTIAASAFFFSLITIMIYLLIGSVNEYLIIFAGVSLSLIICYLFSIFANGFRYSYKNSFISFSLAGVVYKRLNYKKYDFICISNGSYNNKYGSSPLVDMPIRYKSKGNNETIYTVYPFITLHNLNYPINKIKKGMSSRVIYRIDNDNSFCLGICWFDSLTELLVHSNYPIYLLEDVYLRFKEPFDSVFKLNNIDVNKIYIISEENTESTD